MAEVEDEKPSLVINHVDDDRVVDLERAQTPVLPVIIKTEESEHQQVERSSTPKIAKGPVNAGLYKHKCGFCDSTFQKLEHLRRHERSHTKERPFECVECGKKFTRADSLVRHSRLHENMAIGLGSSKELSKKGSPRNTVEDVRMHSASPFIPSPSKLPMEVGLEAHVDRPPFLSERHLSDMRSWASSPAQSIATPPLKRKRTLDGHDEDFYRWLQRPEVARQFSHLSNGSRDGNLQSTGFSLQGPTNSAHNTPETFDHNHIDLSDHLANAEIYGLRSDFSTPVEHHYHHGDTPALEAHLPLPHALGHNQDHNGRFPQHLAEDHMRQYSPYHTSYLTPQSEPTPNLTPPSMLDSSGHIGRHDQFYNSSQAQRAEQWQRAQHFGPLNDTVFANQREENFPGGNMQHDVRHDPNIGLSFDPDVYGFPSSLETDGSPDVDLLRFLASEASSNFTHVVVPEFEPELAGIPHADRNMASGSRRAMQATPDIPNTPYEISPVPFIGKANQLQVQHQHMFLPPEAEDFSKGETYAGSGSSQNQSPQGPGQYDTSQIRHSKMWPFAEESHGTGHLPPGQFANSQHDNWGGRPIPAEILSSLEAYPLQTSYSLNEGSRPYLQESNRPSPLASHIFEH